MIAEPRPLPNAERIPLTELERRLHTVVAQVADEDRTVIVEREGDPVAIVPLSDIRRLEQFERRRREGRAALERIGAAFADVPVEEIEREVDRGLAEVRAERRSARRG